MVSYNIWTDDLTISNKSLYTFTGFLWCGVNGLPAIILIAREIRATEPYLIPNMEIPEM